jgi:hypothetical protein
VPRLNRDVTESTLMIGILILLMQSAFGP